MIVSFFLATYPKTADNAAKITTSLIRVMTNSGGRPSSKRNILLTIIHSVMLHSFEICAHTVGKEMYREQLAQIQRRAVLGVASAFRTISKLADLVVAAVISIALMAKDRQRKYKKKQEPRNIKILNKHHYNVAEALRNVMGNFFLTQFRTGAGRFKDYLHRMKTPGDGIYLYCSEEIDGVYHTFVDCNSWSEWRNADD